MKYRPTTKGKIKMIIEINLYKKIIKFIILFLVIMVILNISKVYASTIDSSNISININSNGVCYIEEKLYVTAIGDPSDNSTKYFVESPSIQLTRGQNIEKLCINNVEISEKNIDKYYNDYVGIINLAYSQSRTLSIFIILHKKDKYNFL